MVKEDKTVTKRLKQHEEIKRWQQNKAEKAKQIGNKKLKQKQRKKK